jgi:hypothetical protein
MLRLERVSRDCQVNVAIRDKESWWNQTVLVAFFIAISLHGISFLIFQITPFKVRIPETIYPPVVVDSDLALSNEKKEILALTDPDSEYLSTQFFFEHVPSVPSLPGMSKSPMVRHMEYIKEASVLANPFTQLEQEIHHFDFPVFSPPQLVMPSIVLVISGGLADKKLLVNGIDDNRAFLHKLSPKSMSSQKVIYTVQVEEQTGGIFWYSLKQTAETNSLNHLAEKILRSMQFHTQPHAFVTSGEIEIHFHFDELKEFQ